MPAVTGNRGWLANPIKLLFIILASKFFGFDFLAWMQELFARTMKGQSGGNPARVIMNVTNA
jgi:hypothetical protein